MPILSARFSLTVSSPCLLAWPDEENPEVAASLGEFRIEVNMLSAEDWASKERDDVNWTTELCRLDVTVSRDEPDAPPDVVVMPDGTRDLTFRGAYLRSKLPQYQAAALEMANRILQFFQYSLFTPLVRPIPPWDGSLDNPTWFDGSANELRAGTLTAGDRPIPGARGELGARKLTPAELPALQSFIAAPSEPSLAATLLSDAQAAWFEGSLRRAVLELAICTEVLAKRSFFAQASPAGAAFDYLEDKAKISVRVLDLLDGVAEEAFARNYKKEEPIHYKCINQLFRCRNKIAHRGELTFRDDAGKTVDVGPATVESWWHAVANVKSWLESL